ncbi:O-antigen ligase family protein [Aliarcobacter cryaerophilus]|uniref:hypothetical protein n=1 Tax=Aliarcobacter cryaerophilus TaxID=28198 RepID=UPI003DA6CB22
MFLYFILLLTAISLTFSSMPKDVAIKELYVGISIILGFFAFLYFDKFKSILKILILINFLVMINDVYSGEYLFNFDPIGNYYQIDRGKGLFGYSKSAGAFVIFAALIFRKDKSIMFIILLSSIMTGSRSAMIFVLLVFLTDYLIDIKQNITFKQVIYFLSIILIGGFLVYLYFLDHMGMWYRIEGSFNFSDSGTHGYRFYIWNEYLKVVNDFNVFHLLFGNTAYTNNYLGNGAENAFLTVLTNNGLIMFLIFFVPILFFSVLSMINFRLFYPFILLLGIFQFGRQGLGWADGILFWAYIYSILYSDYFQSILSRITKKEIAYV